MNIFNHITATGKFCRKYLMLFFQCVLLDFFLGLFIIFTLMHFGPLIIEQLANIVGLFGNVGMTGTEDLSLLLKQKPQFQVYYSQFMLYLVHFFFLVYVGSMVYSFVHGYFLLPRILKKKGTPRVHLYRMVLYSASFFCSGFLFYLFISQFKNIFFIATWNFFQYIPLIGSFLLLYVSLVVGVFMFVHPWKKALSEGVGVAFRLETLFSVFVLVGLFIICFLILSGISAVHPLLLPLMILIFPLFTFVKIVFGQYLIYS